MVEPKTIESYEWVARKYVRPSLADRKVAALRPIDVDALCSQLHGRGLSARTVRICHTVIRQALEQARRWGLIARNPALDATPPVQHRREVSPPTVEQVQRLLAAAKAEDADFSAYLSLLAATGCRRGAACALRWSDTDLERAEVVIRPSPRSARRCGRRTPRPTSPAASPSTSRPWPCSGRSACGHDSEPRRWMSASPTTRCCSAT